MITISDQIRNTIAYLRRCQEARRAGILVSFATDPAWLLDQAINRRAGWPDDPTHSRGSCMPVMGRYPKRAEGQHMSDTRNLSRRLNNNIVVREREVPEKWRSRISENRLTISGEA